MTEATKERIDPEGKDYELVVRVKTNPQENFDCFVKGVQELIRLHKIGLGGILQLKGMLEQAAVNETIAAAVGATLQEIAQRGAKDMGHDIRAKAIVEQVPLQRGAQ